MNEWMGWASAQSSYCTLLVTWHDCGLHRSENMPAKKKLTVLTVGTMGLTVWCSAFYSIQMVKCTKSDDGTWQNLHRTSSGMTSMPTTCTPQQPSCILTDVISITHILYTTATITVVLKFPLPARPPNSPHCPYIQLYSHHTSLMYIIDLEEYSENAARFWSPCWQSCESNKPEQTRGKCFRKWSSSLRSWNKELMTVIFCAVCDLLHWQRLHYNHSIKSQHRCVDSAIPCSIWFNDKKLSQNKSHAPDFSPNTPKGHKHHRLRTPVLNKKCWRHVCELWCWFSITYLLDRDTSTAVAMCQEQCRH